MAKILGHQEIRANLTKLAQEGALSHGYIFYGPSMVGKRTVAQALAYFLEKGVLGAPAAHEVLQDSKLINLALAKELDPNIKESIGIDAVREIKNFLWQRPNSSPRRTLIIDDAELLTAEAQNALLKITEEPPASSLLIVIASDLENLMGTIRSRLQQVYFGAVAGKEISRWLMEEAGAAVAGEPSKVTKATADALAAKSFGKPGLAWRLAHDQEFQKTLEAAQKFLKSTQVGRKDLIKKLLEPDSFSLRNFLDAVIITLAWEKPSKTKAALWHKALALYQDANNFSLNPRLQLENLLIIK